MKCLNCGKTILETGLLLKNGSACLKLGESKKIEHDSQDTFVQCPHCNAKNIFASDGNKLYFHKFI